jgi:hypothetical protein
MAELRAPVFLFVSASGRGGDVSVGCLKGF